MPFSAIAPDGTFSGYASLFGAVDLGRDVVERGAFRRSLRARGAAGVRMLFQHDPKEPIGTWLDLSEDARGLRVTGRLNGAVGRAREIGALVEAGGLDGLSIGFSAAQGRRDRRSGVRRLADLDLWEVSIVSFPMLPGARISRR